MICYVKLFCVPLQLFFALLMSVFPLLFSAPGQGLQRAWRHEHQYHWSVEITEIKNYNWHVFEVHPIFFYVSIHCASLHIAEKTDIQWIFFSTSRSGVFFSPKKTSWSQVTTFGVQGVNHLLYSLFKYLFFLICCLLIYVKIGFNRAIACERKEKGFVFVHIRGNVFMSRVQTMCAKSDISSTSTILSPGDKRPSFSAAAPGLSLVMYTQVSPSLNGLSRPPLILNP